MERRKNHENDDDYVSGCSTAIMILQNRLSKYTFTNRNFYLLLAVIFPFFIYTVEGCIKEPEKRRNEQPNESSGKISK